MLYKPICANIIINEYQNIFITFIVHKNDGMSIKFNYNNIRSKINRTIEFFIVINQIQFKYFLYNPTYNQHHNIYTNTIGRQIINYNYRKLYINDVSFFIQFKLYYFISRLFLEYTNKKYIFTSLDPMELLFPNINKIKIKKINMMRYYKINFYYI
jgi:hypothetical protein